MLYDRLTQAYFLAASPVNPFSPNTDAERDIAYLPSGMLVGTLIIAVKADGDEIAVPEYPLSLMYGNMPTFACSAFSRAMSENWLLYDPSLSETTTVPCPFGHPAFDMTLIPGPPTILSTTGPETRLPSSDLFGTIKPAAPPSTILKSIDASISRSPVFAGSFVP